MAALAPHHIGTRRATLALAGLTVSLLLLAEGFPMGRDICRPPAPAADTTSPARGPLQAKPGPVGVWMVSTKQLREVNAKAPEGILFGGPWPFRFDGVSAYLHIFRLHAWEEGPEDNVYRLRAKWRGDTLYYLHTAGRWTRLASFVGGRFLVRENGVVWSLEKTDVSTLGEFYGALAKDRPLWSYPPLAEARRPLRMSLEWGSRPGSTRGVSPERVLREDPDATFEFKDHPEGNVELAWSPDGRRLVSFSYSWDPENEKHVGYAKVWDTNSGKAEGRLEGLPALVWGVAFSPDGRRLALADDSGTVRVWDAAARRELFRLAGHAGPALCVAFSRDGRLLASGGKDRSIVVWDTKTRKKQRVLRGHADEVKVVAFAPGGGSILSACLEKGVKVWDLAAAKEERSLTGPGRFCTASFDTRGKRVAIGGWGSVGVWGLRTGRPVGRFSRKQAHVRQVAGIAFSPDGRYVASGGEEGDIRFWEASTGRRLFTIRGYRGEVRGVAFSPDGKHLATCGRGESIEVWDVAGLLKGMPAGPADPLPLRGHEDWVWSLAMTPGGKTVVSGSKDETLRVWDVASGEVRAVLSGHIEEIGCVACSPDGRLLASGGEDGEIKLWEVMTRRECATWQGHPTAVTALTFSPDGRTLVSASYGGPVKFWGVAPGKLRGTLAGPAGPVVALAFTPDGKVLVTAGSVADWRSKDANEFYRPGEVTLWDAATGKPLHRFRGYPSGVTCLAITADGRTLAAGSDDQTVRLYDLRARKERAVLKGHVDPVRSVAVTSDGKLVASGDWKGMIRLWDGISGEERSKFEAHSFWVNSLTFTPDGKTLVSGSADHTVKFWKIARVLRQR